MRVNSRVVVAAVLGCLVCGAVSDLQAADPIEKKWRVGFFGGFNNPQDEIPSDAANVLNLFTREYELEEQYIDPRDDSSVFGTLELRPAGLATFSGQYALTNMFIVEASIGYSQLDLGQVEIQAQFDQIPIDEDINFNFKTYRVTAGTVDMVPIQFTGLWRFRPRASFNPYLGAGIGYMVVGYKPTDAFDQVSYNLDASLGGQGSVTSNLRGSPTLIGPTSQQIRDLTGASVDAGDSFIWQLAGGAEFAIKRRWVLVVDARWMFSSQGVNIGFNGSEDVGIAVPQLNDFIDQPAGLQSYGPMRITTGGVIDGGSLVPVVGAPATTDCAVTPANCVFDPTQKDGVPDPGYYYLNGGSIDYETLTVQFGVRYTF